MYSGWQFGGPWVWIRGAWGLYVPLDPLLVQPLLVYMASIAAGHISAHVCFSRGRMRDFSCRPPACYVLFLSNTLQFSKRLTVNKCTVCLFKRKLQETDYWLLIWDSYSESDLDLLSRLLKYFVLSLVKSVNKSEKMENTYCCDSNWNWNKESK